MEDDYQIKEAENGEEGIKQAEEIMPDLIITDVMMPRMDGYTFSKKIRHSEKTSHIPIIMLTAKAGEDSKIEGLETGVDDYLTKPFSARELQVRIKNLIELRKTLRKQFSTATIITPSEISATPMDQAFLQRIVEIVETHIGDEQFSPEVLGQEAGMTVRHLNRKLKALIDQPAAQFIRSLRLQRAADLLKQQAGNITEICFQVGFSNLETFTRNFKKQFGVSPSEYK